MPPSFATPALRAPQDEGPVAPLRNHSAPHKFPCMSRAFTKEPDEGEALEDLPDRPISEHPNLVTAAGLAQIEDALVRAQAELTRAQAANDRAAIAHAGPHLRYWTARRWTAQLMAAPHGTEQRPFGSTGTVASHDV